MGGRRRHRSNAALSASSAAQHGEGHGMGQDDRERLVRNLRYGRIGRRQAIARLAAWGLSAGSLGSALTASSLRPARAAAGGRGASGVLKLLYWQAPTILNPHLSQGTKDFHASHICCEALLTVDAAGNFAPVLAANVPSRANGQIAADGRSVTYKLKPGIKWADGRPFTSDDVVFTYQFIANKQTGATTYGSYVDVAKVEPVDPTTVKITFKAPTPAWYLPFVGSNGMILPRHALDGYIGSNARNAPFNTKAFGTGPYMVDTFHPGDLVVYKINPYYRDPGKPAFSQVQMKGGGDATSAARAVLETGEYDYAWNLQVEDEVLVRMEKGGKGRAYIVDGGDIEFIQLNITDPWNEVDGERGSAKSKHFAFSEPAVRQAMAMLCDKKSMQEYIYGRTGKATGN